MATRTAPFRIWRSVAGPALAGIGILILGNSIAELLARLNCALGTGTAGDLDVLQTLMLRALEVFQTVAADQQRIVHAVLLHLAASCWPVLLVVLGAALSRDHANSPERKNC